MPELTSHILNLMLVRSSKCSVRFEFLPGYSTMNVGKYSHRCPAFEGMINMASERNNFEGVMRLAVMLLLKLAMTNFNNFVVATLVSKW